MNKFGIYILLFICSISFGQEDEWELKKETRQKISNQILKGNYSSSGYNESTVLVLNENNFQLFKNSYFCIEGVDSTQVKGQYVYDDFTKSSTGHISFFPTADMVSIFRGKDLEYDSIKKEMIYLPEIIEVDTIDLSSRSRFFLQPSYKVYYWNGCIYLIGSGMHSVKLSYAEMLFAHFQNTNCKKCSFGSIFISEEKTEKDTVGLFAKYHRLYRKKDISANYKVLFEKTFTDHYLDIDSYYFNGELVKDTLGEPRKIQVNYDDEDNLSELKYIVYELDKGYKDGLDVGHILSNECIVLEIVETFSYKSLAKRLDYSQKCSNSKISLKYKENNWSKAFISYIFEEE